MTDNRTEIWLSVDTEEDPIAYALQRGSERPDRIEVEITGPSTTLRLGLPMAEARVWAAELFSAVSLAYREATGDPSALSYWELSSLVKAIAVGNSAEPATRTSPARCPETGPNPITARDLAA